MALGYACITEGVNNINFKNIKLANLEENKIKLVIEKNLESLENAIKYNIKNNIKLYRITSELIPFASMIDHLVNWENEYKEKFKKIGKLIKNYNIRVSMHPGQYTVLNSFNELTVKRSIDDLEYHCKILDLLGIDQAHKMILHVGGIYNDKEEAIKNFIRNYQRLTECVKKRLVIENDDKSYNIFDCLKISNILNIPVVYDNLHNSINCYDSSITDGEWIMTCSKTWKEEDGNQKVHYSQQDPNKKTGSHSPTINLEEFLIYYETLIDKNIDIMLEVKDKNISTIKCINGVRYDKDIKYLKKEWLLYKYLIYEKSEMIYHQINNLLKEGYYPVIKFYELIDEALLLNSNNKSYEGILKIVWKRLEKKVTNDEKVVFFKKLDKFNNNNLKIETFKKFIYLLALKYEDKLLINSYFLNL